MADSSLPRDGWHRDLPDGRDLTLDAPLARKLFRKLGPAPGGKKPPTGTVDLREWLPRVNYSGGLRDCVARVGVAMVQYFERRSNGRVLDASSRFLYKMTRRLLDWPGDCGAQFRPTWKALVRFGLPPSDLCRDNIEQFDEPPEPHFFSFSDIYKNIIYLRLDARGLDGKTTLERVKSSLRAGFPCSCGFPLTSSLEDGPDIPFPTDLDSVRGGLAVLVVGYDDHRRHRSTRGALLVRTSWSEDFGERGYGWLPYAYVEENLSADFWTLTKPEWLKSGEFFDPGAT
jgi:C1A family cysteine protease